MHLLSKLVCRFRLSKYHSSRPCLGGVVDWSGCCCASPLPLSLWRSKVLCRWLASLPVQLSQLGHRNPALSAQIITSIQAAASRGHKDLLNSLQACACTVYGMNSRHLVAHCCHDLNHLQYIHNVFNIFSDRYFTYTFIYWFSQPFIFLYQV